MAAPNKQLKFAGNLVTMILNNKKTTTWRVADNKQLEEGDVVDFIHAVTGEKFGVATFTQVYEKKMQDLNEVDAEGHEPINSLSEIYERYKMYYPNEIINGDTKIKIIRFTFQRL